MKRLFGIALAAAFAVMIAAPPAAAQHAAVGAEKRAKTCHKIQFDSWSTSKHATAAGDKKAECETCHGNGADYSKMAIMKDLVKSKEAGLIAKLDTAQRTKSCHKAGEITPRKLATCTRAQGEGGELDGEGSKVRGGRVRSNLRPLPPSEPGDLLCASYPHCRALAVSSCPSRAEPEP